MTALNLDQQQSSFVKLPMNPAALLSVTGRARGDNASSIVPRFDSCAQCFYWSERLGCCHSMHKTPKELAHDCQGFATDSPYISHISGFRAMAEPALKAG